MKRENKTGIKLDFFDILVSLMAVFYLIFLLGVVNNRGILGWDEAARSMGGVTLIKYFTAKISFNDLISILGTNHYYVYQGTLLYGPLHALSTGISYALFGFSVFIARLPTAIFAAIVVLLTYYISHIMYGDRRTGIFAALFIIGSPIYFDFSTMNFSEIPIVFSISSGTYLLFKARKSFMDGGNKNKDIHCVLLGIASGVMFGFASVTKPSAAFIGLPILIYILLSTVKKESIKKIHRKKLEKQKKHGIYNNQIIILSIPLLIMVLCVISYWSYLNSIGFLQLYLNFWMGGRGYHPETEPFSLRVLLESWKPFLLIFPVLIFLLFVTGLYQMSRRKKSPEELFLISWVAVYFFSLVASGAISPQYPLPSIPAMAIIASTAMVKMIDSYEPLNIIKRQNNFNSKSIAAAIIILFIMLQSAIVPVYKSISLQSGNEIKGEAYNPLIIRTFLNKYVPSFYWVNTRYYNGSTIDFYSRGGLDEKDLDIYRSIEMNIKKDIQKNNYQSATAIFLAEDSNYFDFWFTVDDKYLKYRFISLEPRFLSQYAVQDKAPKYLVISAENEKKIIQNITKKDNELGYSIYKMHVETDSIQLEDVNIDQIVGYT
jgi:hypothetical protein